METERPWYVLYTGTKTEEATRIRLEREGIDAWYPTGKRWKKRRAWKSFREFVFPAFPRYVFFRFRGRPDWEAVKGGRIRRDTVQIDGVAFEMIHDEAEEPVTVACNGGAPIRLKDEVIVLLREREANGRYNIGRKPRTASALVLKEGDEVLITEGAGEGRVGVVGGTPTSNTIDVIIREFQRSVKVPADKLEIWDARAAS